MRKNAKGETLKVEFLNADPAWERIINPYVENLKALGVDASLANVDDAQMSERTDPPNFDFDMITGNESTGYELGDDMTQTYGSATANNSSYNKIGLASKSVDQLSDVARATKTKDENVTAAKALDRVLLREKIWVPQWYKNVFTPLQYVHFLLSYSKTSWTGMLTTVFPTRASKRMVYVPGVRGNVLLA